MITNVDTLFPWEFPNRQDRFHFFPEVDSTMEIARELAHDGCPAFTVVTADRQTKGRGRLRRTWLSDLGGLYFTLVLRSKIPPALSFRINFAAAVVLARLLQREFNLPAKVKWPNDILVNGKKICGMLSEMEVEAEALVFVNIGIGININNDPSSQEPQATSLQKELGRKVLRKQILAGFLDDFENRLEQPATLVTIIDEWKAENATIGRPVRIVTGDRQFAGTAMDVDETGALILELADGRRQQILYGDCFHQAT